MSEAFPRGTIVRSKTDGAIGVVAMDVMGCCSPNEEPVVYDGSDAFNGTDRKDLETVGVYQERISDPEKCGLGAGALCCMYLAVEAEGFACKRFSELRNRIIFGKHRAQGQPLHLFPKCQDDIQEAIATAEQTTT